MAPKDRAANNFFFLKGHVSDYEKFWSDKTKMRSDIILQYCLISEPANLMRCHQNKMFMLEGKKHFPDIMSDHSLDFIGLKNTLRYVYILHMPRPR